MSYRRAFLLLAILALEVAAWYVMQWYNDDMDRQIAEIQRGVPEWDEVVFSAVAKSVASNYAAAARALETNGFAAAYGLAFYEGKNALDPWVAQYGSKRFGASGETVRAMAARLHEEYHAAFTPAFGRAIELAKTGDLTLAELQNVVAWHAAFPEIAAEHAARADEIAEARALQARRWVRVTVASEVAPDRVRPIMERIVRDRTKGVGHFKFVFGSSSGPAEDAALFMTIEMRLDAAFAASGPGGAAQVPETCTLRFTTRQARVVPTTWDRLAPITMAKKAPESMNAEQAARLRQVHTEAMVKGVEAALAGLKPFAFFPGYDLDKSPLVKGGHLDGTALLARWVLAPDRLDKELQPVLSTQDAALQQGLIAALIDLGDERYAGWVVQRLSSAGYKPSPEVVAAMERRPDFAAYEPVMALMKGSTFPPPLLGALSGHFQDEKLKAATAERIRNLGSVQRAMFVSALLAEATPEELRSYGSLLADKDPAVALAACKAVLAGDPVVARELAAAYLDRVSPRVKEQLAVVLVE
jgi:hypothetical protein